VINYNWHLQVEWLFCGKCFQFDASTIANPSFGRFICVWLWFCLRMNNGNQNCVSWKWSWHWFMNILFLCFVLFVLINATQWHCQYEIFGCNCRNRKRRNCLLRHVTEGKIKGGIEVTVRRGRRRRKLLDDLTEGRWFSHLKEQVLDRTMWRAGFGRGFGPVLRQTAKWMNELPQEWVSESWEKGEKYEKV
jgi:hypothetical protein